MLFSGDERNVRIPNSKMDYLQKQSLYWEHRPCMFQANSYRLNNEKMMKKPNCLYKESMENFNDYSSFFASKTYSNVSNSILSYIVGGFVGSKSQMNNNKKHNLSYDLSAVISNLLNPWKYEHEKSSLKTNNENLCTPSKLHSEGYSKFILNNSNQKSEKEKGSPSDAIEVECLFTAPDHQKSISDYDKNCHRNQLEDKNKIMYDLSNSQACDLNKGISLSSTLQNKDADINIYESTCENKLCSKKTMEECNGNFERLKNDSNPSITTTDKEESSSSSLRFKNSNSFSSSNSDCESIIPDDCCSEIVSNKADNGKHSIDFLPPERFHYQSECSVESTDSDSFIIFDDHIDDVYDGTKREVRFCLLNDINNYNSEDGSEDEEEDENEEYNESDENSSSDEYDFCPVNKNILLANEKWLKSYRDVIIPLDEGAKKVRFSKNVKVNKIVAWDHAYRAARLGPWEQLARDRVRFQERISRLSLIISPILESEHRSKIYRKLHS